MPYRKTKTTSYKDLEAKEDTKKMYPKVDIPLTDLPEAKDWEVGTTYNLAMKVKMVGITMGEYRDESTYEILAIKVLLNPKKKEKRYDA